MPDPERGAQRRDEGPAAPTKKRGLLLAAAALASALLIGLGAGWLLFGRDSGPPMDAEQREAWTALEASGDYDAGSIRMLGEKYGFTAWYATKSGLKLECLVLTPASNAVSCAPPPDPSKEDEAGYWGQLSVQVPVEEAEGSIVQAYVVRDSHDRPVAIIDKWENTGPDDWTAMFQGTELDIAKVIVEQKGVDGASLQVVGYDGDTPIWLTQSEKACLYLADTTTVITEMCDLDLTPGTKMRFEQPGVAYDVRATEHGLVVTVIRSADPAQPGPEEPAIDDTTGKTAD
ncbi:hypothetical protein DY023_01685 [Microbacterium bovistercoris]|uniref:Uncharacterized protein n=1 Tax=Microbacterium bovistercoris TaxID=2293570 RepID=A0A371NZ75_9MICO|nr:hypothetical protein DY023_01685 [Microbacterium bovistercoris]